MASPAVDDAAGRVDIQAYLALGVLSSEEEDLGHDHVGHIVVNRRAQENDAFFQ